MLFILLILQNISQNLDNIGLIIFDLFAVTIKNFVLLYISIDLRNADWASNVKLSAFNKTIDLKLVIFLWIIVFAKNLKLSLINFMFPFPKLQFNINVFIYIICGNLTYLI